MTEAIESRIDVATRTTRGRICPRCGGKIIPSIRSVYGEPGGAFAAWQCERCSYEEVFSKPAPPPARETSTKGAARAAAPTAASVTTRQTSGAVAKSAPAMKDPQGRDLPADVRAVLSQMKKAQEKLPTD